MTQIPELAHRLTVVVGFGNFVFRERFVPQMRNEQTQRHSTVMERAYRKNEEALAENGRSPNVGGARARNTVASINERANSPGPILRIGLTVSSGMGVSRIS